MEAPVKVGIVAGLAVLVVAGVAWVAPLFLPEGSTHVDEALGADARLLAEGTFRDGDEAHHVSGRVAVYGNATGHFLRFEDYEATDGPDVYLYLTADPHARSAEAVESGLRLLVPGGEEDGRATLRGNFNVPLPEGFDPAAYRGLSAWCDRFNVLFGSAELALA